MRNITIYTPRITCDFSIMCLRNGTSCTVIDCTPVESIVSKEEKNIVIHRFRANRIWPKINSIAFPGTVCPQLHLVRPSTNAVRLFIFNKIRAYVCFLLIWKLAITLSCRSGRFRFRTTASFQSSFCHYGAVFVSTGKYILRFGDIAVNDWPF